jgi:hypothetical protein
MKRYYQCVCDASLALLIFFYSADRASSAAAITDPGQLSDVRSPIGLELATYGFQFTVGSQDLLVTAFGIWDAHTSGLLANHQVGIWDSSGALLESVTVPLGNSTVNIDSFCYQPLPVQILLAAGQTYTLGGTFIGGDPDGMKVGDIWSGPTYSADIESEASRYIRDQFALPTDSIPNASYVGPNFLYSTVPEPSALQLFTAGLIAFLRYRGWRIRKSAAL